ncbi:hypothetical protein FKM82_017218 [Ascaphus truei]
MSHKSTSGLKTRSESSCSLELRTVWQANSDRDNNIQGLRVSENQWDWIFGPNYL